MDTKKCIKCNAVLPAIAKFCGSCGTLQPEQTPTIPQPQIQQPTVQQIVNTPKESDKFDEFFEDESTPTTTPVIQPTIEQDSIFNKLKQPEEIKPSVYDKLMASPPKVEETTKVSKSETQNNKNQQRQTEQPKKQENSKRSSSKQKTNKNQPQSQQNEEKNNDIIYEKPITISKYSGPNIEEQALSDINTLNLSETDNYVLIPAAYPNIMGYKAMFIGNNGTMKEKAIETIGEVLYKENKIKTPYPKYTSFGDIPAKWDNDVLYVIKDLKSAITYLFNIEDFSDFASQNATIYKNKLDSLIMSPRSTYIIIDALPSEIKNFIALDSKIGYVFDAKIKFKDLANFEIYNLYVEYLPESHKSLLPPDFKDKFIHYLERNRRYIPFNNMDLAKYLSDYTSRYKDLTLPPEKFTALSLDDAFANIIGMENVKTKVRELQEFLATRSLLEEAGAVLPDLNLHMMFLGNPGIGKTTIARIIGKILFDLGYIREDKFVEVTSKDLVGSGNQTGLKTNRVIMSAMGGVLFVDEAYSLSNSCGQAGAEAIANLIKAMEDNKGDLVCMFAGYTLEMHDFVNANSGIASRINYTFQFQDYSLDELYDIFKLKLKKTKMTIAPETEAPLKAMIKTGSMRKNAGNGRFIDKLLQRTMTKQASLHLPPDKMMLLQPAAVPTIEEMMASF